MNNIIKRKWNQNSMVIIEDLQGMAFQAESGGHTFQISGVDGEGNAVALSGTPAGVLLRADGQDVTLTCSVSGGVVSATLPANAYVVPGRFGLTIFLTSDGQKTAIYAAVGTVGKTSSGTVAPPAGSDVVTLVNAIAAAVATIPASYTDLMAGMAPTYSTSGLYAVGSYAWYSGKLYRCTTSITSGETWTSAHWTLANLGSDLVDLKSAFMRYQNKTGIIEYDYSEHLTAKGSCYFDIPYNGVTYENVICKAVSKSESIPRVMLYLVRSNNTTQYISDLTVGTAVVATANADFVAIRYYMPFSSQYTGDVSLSVEMLFEDNILERISNNEDKIQETNDELYDNLDEIGDCYPNIAYSKAEMIDTEYTANGANESINGGIVPYSFTSGNYYLLMYKLKITGYINTSAGNVRPTMKMYSQNKRLDPDQGTSHAWLSSADYTLGDEIIVWDVVKCPYTASDYVISLQCPSGTNPFNTSTTKITYKSIAIVAVTGQTQGEKLKDDIITGFSFKHVYFIPDVTEKIIDEIINQHNVLNGFNAFSRFCVVGDSLSVGYYTDSSNQGHFTDYAHSWPYFIEKLFGAKAYWAGYSGQNCKTWLEQTGGTWGVTYTRNLGAMPLYFLAMGANEENITVGTIADINDDNPTTLYGYVGKTIRELRSISPNSYIIAVGVSRNQNSASTINAVYEAVCGSFSKCYYFNVQDFLRTTQFTECIFSGHYSALGYMRLAKLYNWVVESVMNANVSDFLYINEADITTQPK